MVSLCHILGSQPPQSASRIHIRHIQSVWAHWYAVHRHTVAALHGYTHPTWLRFWCSGSLGHLWRQMMFLFLRHVWGSQPPQSACPIHIRHIQSVWAHWYAVHRHTAAALHSYIYPTWLRFWESGSYVESNDVITSWLADRHLNLLPASILDIYKVFEHIDMLSIGIGYQPYTLILPTLLGSDFGVLGHLWSQINDVITPCLRLTATSNCFPHPY
jgi:hypothetical protein